MNDPAVHIPLFVFFLAALTVPASVFIVAVVDRLSERRSGGFPPASPGRAEYDRSAAHLGDRRR